MLIHAENETKKKVTACAVVNGMLCKNCKSYSKQSFCGFCSYWEKPIFDENGYCNMYKDDKR